MKKNKNELVQLAVFFWINNNSEAAKAIACCWNPCFGIKSEATGHAELDYYLKIGTSENFRLNLKARAISASDFELGYIHYALAKSHQKDTIKYARLVYDIPVPKNVLNQTRL